MLLIPQLLIRVLQCKYFNDSSSFPEDVPILKTIDAYEREPYESFFLLSSFYSPTRKQKQAHTGMAGFTLSTLLHYQRLFEGGLWKCSTVSIQ
jgi:hypothetical protein